MKDTHRRPESAGLAEFRSRRQQPIPRPIRRIYLPRSVLKATEALMQRFGREERECYAWWGGYFTAAHEGQVLTAFVPDIPTDYGRIELGLPEIGRLHEELRARDQVLLVELHTHPPDAGGQNGIDAAHPAATYPGFISIIVPDFAIHGLELASAWVYEYQTRLRWTELSPREIANRFIVEDTLELIRP